MADSAIDPRLRIGGAPETDPSVELAGPNPPLAERDGVTLFVHGWFGRRSSVADAAAFERAFASRDEPALVVPVQWTAATPNFWRARRRADAAGAALADWLRRFRNRRPDVDLRLVAHSLGARLGLRALSALDGAVVFDAVALLAPGVDADAVCPGGPYEDGIRSSAGSVYAYVSRRDQVLRWVYRVLALHQALGTDGPRCGKTGSRTAPLTTVDVTAVVGSHGAYLDPDRNERWGDRLTTDLRG
ncbi:alpha/beta hydrolase [Halovivax limisalsi]|uniref:alpha/beta hydrolase n=1 Tax=Halovivax limisalsi TaxID=1453760 RepID=UPI001FFD2A76|nr:alpha/beta hydrolase [Halovivax limisalsi]